MILWTIAIVLTILFLLLLLLVWLRKIQFDAIHQNFLDLEDHFGGRVIRNGFAIRPRFAGQYKNKEFTISITTEGGKEERKYYICVTFQGESHTNFSVMSAEWLGNQAENEDNDRCIVPIADGQFKLETTNRARLRELDLPKIEKAVHKLVPFAYVLVGKKRIMLERISQSVVQDTKIENLRPLLEGMHLMAKLVGGKK